jgi:hypothetical protein
MPRIAIDAIGAFAAVHESEIEIRTRRRTGTYRLPGRLQFRERTRAAMKTTPTTKILAIGTVNPGFEQSQVFAVLPEEVRETVDLYLDGKIEQWYSLQGRPGVAFIINVTDPAIAHEMLEKLPLGKAHMMSFELIPIGPLNPLRFLQGMQPKP